MDKVKEESLTGKMLTELSEHIELIEAFHEEASFAIIEVAQNASYDSIHEVLAMKDNDDRCNALYNLRWINNTVFGSIEQVALEKAQGLGIVDEELLGIAERIGFLVYELILDREFDYCASLDEDE